MKAKVIGLLFMVIFFFSCSSLTFIPTPPTMTIATTDYVDKAVTQQVYKSREVTIEEAKKAAEEILEKERKKIDSLAQIVEEQKRLLEVTSQRLKEFALFSEQLKITDTKLEKNISQTMDSLKSVLTKIENLKNKNSEILQKVNELKASYDEIPKQTLKELIDAINSYYEEQK